MTDLWISQPTKFLSLAMDDGFRRFTWHTADAIRKNAGEMLSWFRANTIGYGQCELLILDHAGAALYDNYSNYKTPIAVYPTWSCDEPFEDLIWLMENNVGEVDGFYNSPTVPPEFRPVKGQKHCVVVQRIPPAGDDRQLFMLRMRAVQLDYPDVKLFISGAKKFADIFGFKFGAVDYYPDELTRPGYSCNRVVLPTGKILPDHLYLDRRYSDWFDLVGMDQADMSDREMRILMCLRSARWASKFWDTVVPFVRPHGGGTGGQITLFVPSEYNRITDKNFVLPAARRKLMRSVGIDAGELDKFMCDTCILMNACTLYRAGSVCTVKGSETVGLADSFGTRNVDVLIGGLTQLVKRNAERLEDAMEIEESNGELDPEVTKLGKVVFDQGVKLAKLLDPNLAGGARVQVNVGVGSGVNAQVAVASSDPKQLMSTVVAELEAAGVKREEITSQMIKGVLTNMAQVSQGQAVSSAVTQHNMKKQERQALPSNVIEHDE